MSVSLVGQCDTPGYAQGVAVVGDYAYVADGNGGLVILRYEEPVKLYLPLMPRGY